MQVSRWRLNVIRGILVVGIIMGLYFGISNLFLTKSHFESSAPAGEAFTTFIDGHMKTEGLLFLSWAVAAAIALRNALQNTGLIYAIAIVFGLLGVETLYGVVAEMIPATDSAYGAVSIVMCVALLVLYPRRQAQS